MSTKSNLLEALNGVIDPDIRRPITELGMLPELNVDESGNVQATLKLTIAGCPAARSLESQTREAILSVAGVQKLDLSVQVMTPEERGEFVKKVRGSKRERQVQFQDGDLTRVIAVTSGKGGVGKSTLTVNLALEIASRGNRVGIIDADIFGFSIPHLLGLDPSKKDSSPLRIGEMILAPEAHGIKVISIGMFLGEKTGRETAISWRGPMLHRTIEQFLSDVWFGDLDFLLIDLPPGTGDVALSIAQLLPKAEVLVVTTPQVTAAEVAIRSGILAFDAGQNVIGVVENMSGLSLPNGEILDIFGSGGGDEVARGLRQNHKNISKTEVKLLAKIPLSQELRELSDAGLPAATLIKDEATKNALVSLADAIVHRKDSIARKMLLK